MTSSVCVIWNYQKGKLQLASFLRTKTELCTQQNRVTSVSMPKRTSSYREKRKKVIPP